MFLRVFLERIFTILKKLAKKDKNSEIQDAFAVRIDKNEKYSVTDINNLFTYLELHSNHKGMTSLLIELKIIEEKKTPPMSSMKFYIITGQRSYMMRLGQHQVNIHQSFNF